MAKVKAPKKDDKSKSARSRTRRSAFERQCISKTFKRMFSGATKEVWLMLLAAERASRRRVKNASGSKAVSAGN